MTMHLLPVYYSTTSTRRRKKSKKSKSLLKAEVEHQKFLKKIRGCSSFGRASGLQPEGSRFDPVHLHQPDLPPVSNVIPVGVAPKKKMIDHNFTIAPAYNKGAYQVISKNSIKDIGK
jgi:hypothetical protein